MQIIDRRTNYNCHFCQMLLPTEHCSSWVWKFFLSVLKLPRLVETSFLQNDTKEKKKLDRLLTYDSIYFPTCLAFLFIWKTLSYHKVTSLFQNILFALSLIRTVPVTRLAQDLELLWTVPKKEVQKQKSTISTMDYLQPYLSKLEKSIEAFPLIDQNLTQLQKKTNVKKVYIAAG